MIGYGEILGIIITILFPISIFFRTFAPNKEFIQ